MSVFKILYCLGSKLYTSYSCVHTHVFTCFYIPLGLLIQTCGPIRCADCLGISEQLKAVFIDEPHRLTLFFVFFATDLWSCTNKTKKTVFLRHSYTHLSYLFVSWNLTRSVSCEHLAKVTNDQLTLSFIRHRLLTVSCAYQTLTDKKGFTLWNIWALKAFIGLTLPK